jgi:hypothetical protein
VADLRHRRRALVGHLELRPGSPRPLDEQLHRRILGERLHRQPLFRVRQGQRRHRELLLAPQPQHRPARDQHLEARGSRQQLGHDRGSLQDLLEVVQHQQELLLIQVALQVLQRWGAPRLLQAQGVGDRGGDQTRIGEGSQIHEEHAFRELLHHVGSELEGEAGLAGAAGAREGEEAHLLPVEQPSGGSQLVFAADEGRGLGGQVMGAEIQGAQRREVDAEIRMQQLEEALGAGEVFELMPAQIAEAHALRQVVAHQFLGGL